MCLEVVGEYYTDHNSNHNQNERHFIAIPTNIIWAAKAENIVKYKKKKQIHVSTFLHLKGIPIIN